MTNAGTTTLSGVKVTDPLSGLSPITPAVVAKLLPGQSTGFTATYSLKQSDVDAKKVVNSATATAKDPNGNDVSDVSDSGNPADEQGTDSDPTITPLKKKTS